MYIEKKKHPYISGSVYVYTLFSSFLPHSPPLLFTPPSLYLSISYFLHHLAFPHILNSSNNISILEGGDVVINCTIESSPDAVVTWYKDGVQVTEAGRIHIQMEDDVIVSDSAVYYS